MSTYREQLRDVAVGQHGYVTVHDAGAVGVPAVELRKLAGRGSLERVGHAVYRMRDVPATEIDQFAQAVLLVGRDAHLTHDSVLALHRLALVNPRRIRIGTPHRVRLRLPTFIDVIRETVPPEDLTIYEGIASITVARALQDCVGRIMPDRLRDAVKDAAHEGLVTRSEASTIRTAIRRHQAQKTVRV